MSRAFALLTAAGSAATFAGVWVASAPAPVVSPAIVVEAAGPVAPVVSVPKPAVRRTVPEADTHVVREFVAPVRHQSRASVGRDASVYYPGCREAWAAGAAPIYRGQPGYRGGMDGDNDGIACEPIR